MCRNYRRTREKRQLIGLSGILRGCGPDMSVEHVKQVPILEVAFHLGITIQRNNKSYCINGHDTKPSMTFYPNSNSFYCFGCGIGGSTIDLVMAAHRCTPQEAISWLRDLRPGATSPARRARKAIFGGDPRGGYLTPTQPNKTPYKRPKSVSEASSGPVTGLLYSYVYDTFLSALSDYDAS